MPLIQKQSWVVRRIYWSDVLGVDHSCLVCAAFGGLAPALLFVVAPKVTPVKKSLRQ